jgi:hypothetical protein
MASAYFLLIQDDHVVDWDTNPGHLSLAGLDALAGFKIAVAHVNEFGDKEVIGIAADVAPLYGCATWRISSNQDGMHRLVNSGGCPARLARRRLRVMFTQGWYGDLCQLPLPVVITPGECVTKMAEF